MYPGKYAIENAEQPCIIMAGSKEVITYKELEGRSNQCAHLLRKHNLNAYDHYAIFMENNSYYAEICCAGTRAGLYYTTINSYLSAEEVAYVVNNSQSKAIITSLARYDVAKEAIKHCPNVELLLIVDGVGNVEPFIKYEQAIAEFPVTPIANEKLGTPMLYSSGTTGRPKGILRSLPDQSPAIPLPLFQFLNEMWQFRKNMVYLSPAPLYHVAPLSSIELAIRNGGTCIIMERFDPEQYLALIEQYRVTHTQLVPTMFSRLLKLPEAIRTRYDLSSLEVALHTAAPCPVKVKQEMISWWGEIIYEYYGATEGLGFTFCDAVEWLAHPGTVGRVFLGEIHILNDEFEACPNDMPGTIWFKSESNFEYYNDKIKTQETCSPDGRLRTVGDIGYRDDEGFLYLTDRKAYTIISGGVNIYPQECENLLITHAKVADVAIIGVPNEDLGEEVKAVVQPMPNVKPSSELERELIEFCHENLARYKCPRSIDFEIELPRLPTGKLYKRILRDRYWEGKSSKIL